MMVKLTVGPVYVGKKSRRIPHSLNARLHWRVRHRWNTGWKTAVWEQIMVSGVNHDTLPYEQARVVITLHTIRLLDIDNAFTCIKPLLDALKDIVIADDNPNCLELAVKQAKVAHRHQEMVSMQIERISA